MYKKYTFFIVLISFCLACIDLAVANMIHNIAFIQTDTTTHALIAYYQFSFLTPYFISFFLLYMVLVSLLPILTIKKQDILISCSYFFLLHLSEDIFYWLLALLTGFYHIGDKIWNPNVLLPEQLQFLSLTLDKIYIIDLFCIIAFYVVWYYTNKRLRIIAHNSIFLDTLHI